MASEPMTEATGQKIVDLLALNLVDGKPRGEQIQLLSRLGMSSPEIGRLLGITPSTVRVTQFRLKKRPEDVTNETP